MIQNTPKQNCFGVFYLAGTFAPERYYYILLNYTKSDYISFFISCIDIK